ASFASSETSTFRIDPNTFRLLADTAYFAWVAAVFVSSLVVWGTSAIALRTGVLPGWYARLGILAGVVQLFGFFFFPFLIWWFWRRDSVRAAAALLVLFAFEAAVAPTLKNVMVLTQVADFTLGIAGIVLAVAVIIGRRRARRASSSRAVAV